MNILEIKGLKKVYGTGEARVEALKGIDMQVERGEFVAVVGTSGSGKTTFLNMVGALDVPTEGQILVDGKELGRLTDDELTVFRRRKIGFIFQQYNLILILPLKMDGKRVDKDYLDELIKILGLEEKKKSRPDKLSGGQQQRVAIARALAIKPSLLLADEPTGNLDSRTSQDVLGLLKITGTRFHQTILMITHNEEIAQMADRIVRIEDGRLVKER